MRPQAWLVTIHDKEIHGEPDVGIAICTSEQEAKLTARAMEADLREIGKCRCVAVIKAVDLNFGYRIGALIRMCR